MTVTILDTFSRSVTDGWGDADEGGAWDLHGTASDFDVASGVGTQVFAAGNGRNAFIGSGIAEGEMLVRFKTDALPTSASLQFYFSFRWTDSSNRYRVQVLWTVGGAFQLAMQQQVANTATTIGAVVSTDLSQATDTWFWVRAWFRDDGSGGLDLDAKIWQDGQAEPDWASPGSSTQKAISRNDPSPADFASGPVAVGGFNGAGNATTVLSWDDFSFDDLVEEGDPLLVGYMLAQP
jgi:hypothetical protein